ncbi:MAG: methylmalonyl Co-A mutase-associated GTPase MeaB [Deltaproteobacteria bacterium]|jgi:LAO/AO transport system kinase|nr:methylmalonyl Co-A mutase-associated GTPase MeaB [Deltaproteobacteria bacterium]
MGNVTLPKIIEGLESGDRRLLAKAISIVENQTKGREELLEYSYTHMKKTKLILGITGAGGSGKSTLIDKMINVFRAEGQAVGVIAVDPSSPYTGGAVLGDRVRMASHNTDAGVFIRSLGSRGAFGGISQGTKDVLYLYKSFGFDAILVESLGVGQAETEITNFVDITAVLLVPGYGDAIQMAKAGIQEIADIFIINKSDRPEAELLYQQLLATFDSLPPDKQPLVVKTVASENIGITELFGAIKTAEKRQAPNKDLKLKARVECEIASRVRSHFDSKLSVQVTRMMIPVLKGELTPFQAADQISSKISIKE